MRQSALVRCSDVAGWAPNAGPSHGYSTSDDLTRFSVGNVASDYEGHATTSRTDITGPTADAATNTAGTGHTSCFFTLPAISPISMGILSACLG